MLKVLALSLQPKLGPSARYRVYNFQRPLRDYGVDMHISPFFTNPIMQRWISGQKTHPLVVARAGIAAMKRLRELKQLQQYDVVYLHRQAAPLSQIWFDPLLIRSTVPLVYNMDDAVFEDYDIVPLLRRSQAATLGNVYLARYVKQVAPNTRAVVTPTAVDMQSYQPAKPSGTPLTVGWVGTPSTFSTYLAPVLPGLVRICHQHNAVFRVVTNPVVQNEAARAGAQFEAWSLKREVASLQNFDIGVMPLSDNRHVRGKCAFKLIQYGAVGLPSVGTDIGANAEVIVNGETGYLTQSPAEMEHRVAELLTSPQKRVRMGQCARAKVEREFSLAAQVPVLAEVLYEAARGKRHA